jgi:predicted peptidase
MRFIFIFLSLFIFNCSNSQDLNLFENKFFVLKNDTLNYRILKPLNYDPAKQYPVHLFLHGAGERGDDNKSQLIHGGKLFLKKDNRLKYNSWVIFPQCPINDRWPSLTIDSWDNNNDYFPNNNEINQPNKTLELVIKFMDQFIEKKQVNKQRIYISGLSMGGMGTFEMLHRRPDMFAAATPICGNGNAELSKLYATKVHLWIFHGSDDKTVKPEYSFKMAKAIINSGGSPRLTLYENVGHDSWNNAFAEKNFLKWIHSKTKKNSGF